MANSWLIQTLIAVVFLTPAWLAMPYFASRYGVSGAVFGVWYFLGAAISMAVFGVPKGALIPSFGIVGSIFVIGLTIGGIANMALFTAVAGAPNPGLPVAIANLTSLTTFFAALALARIAPEHFTSGPLDLRAAAGIILIVIGAALIAVK